MNPTRLATVGVALFAAGCGGSEGELATLKLTPRHCDAIAAAESYIAREGFTAAPPGPGAPGHGAGQTQARSQRYETMKPHAIGLVEGLPGGVPGWTVVFEPSERWLAEIPRMVRESPPLSPAPSRPAVAVLVPARGGAIGMAGIDFNPANIQVRLPNHDAVVQACQSPKQEAPSR